MSECGCRVNITVRGTAIGAVAMYTDSDPPCIVYCDMHAANFAARSQDAERIKELTAHVEMADAHVKKLLAMRREDFARIARLEAALREFASAAEAYMRYHAAKFYEGTITPPTGLWPHIERARALTAPPSGDAREGEV